MLPKFIDEKLKIDSLMFFVSFVHVISKICWCVNRKAFGATFLYWVDFNWSDSGFCWKKNINK
jgi:hypothetical protein